VVEKVENPLIISNFISHHFGTSTSLPLQVQALQTLFVLIGKYQFNYDGFYEKLEVLIETPGIFQSPESSRFMRLLYIASKSSKIPQA
jgi:hypothetical protein